MKKFDFKIDSNTTAGRFTSDMVRAILEDQFGDLHLTLEVINFLSRELGSGETINGNKFNEKINEARQRGYITAEKAEKIKDRVRLPDTMNEHWK